MHDKILFLKAWSPRVMDAVWFGCIPVFLADHYHPPLHGLVDWDQLAVSVPEKRGSVCFSPAIHFIFRLTVARFKKYSQINHSRESHGMQHIFRR